MSVPPNRPLHLLHSTVPGHGPPRGIVHLVGAGPGDPELVTVRGLKLIRRAEALVYDRLVSPELVAEAPMDCERIYVGKAPGRQAAHQEEIGRILIDRALAGKRVVRLKGGDPFVFGRGGEEALALTDAGIPWDVVPAVTSAVGVPAQASIPLTFRGIAADFAVVTGHRAAGFDAPDWRALARIDTLVVLMGVAQLPILRDALLAHGKSGDTPAAIIERGTFDDERVHTTRLDRLAETALEERVQSPATVVIGPVVELRSRLAEGRAQTGQTHDSRIPRIPDGPPYSPELPNHAPPMESTSLRGAHRVS